MNDNDALIPTIVGELTWRKKVGDIKIIDIASIYETIDRLFPNRFSPDEIESLVFRVKMAL